MNEWKYEWKKLPFINLKMVSEPGNWNPGYFVVRPTIAPPLREKKKMSEKSPIVFQSEGTFNPGIILTESNYDVWSQLVEMHIAEREKLSYIRGKTNLPKEWEDGYEKWYAENQKVKRWLLMSMSPEIMKRYLRLPTT